MNRSIVPAAANDVVASGYTKEIVPSQKTRLAGHSVIVSPGEEGKILARAGYEPLLLIADLKLNEIQEKRDQFGILKARRPKFYREIAGVFNKK